MKIGIVATYPKKKPAGLQRALLELLRSLSIVDVPITLNSPLNGFNFNTTTASAIVPFNWTLDPIPASTVNRDSIRI